MKKAASKGGALLPLFVAPSQLKPFIISRELEDGPLKPIDYQDGDRIVRGFDASVLVVVCNIWLSARQAGALQTQQLPKAQKAELLTRALAETGIVALVDERLILGLVTQFEQTISESYKCANADISGPLYRTSGETGKLLTIFKFRLVFAQSSPKLAGSIRRPM